MLVDGQQRVTSLYQYFTGSSDLRLKTIQPYSELEQSAKIEFLEYEVVIRDLGSKSIEEIKEVFRRINSTKYSLNAMEIHNARYDGALKKFAESLAQDDIFSNNNVFRTNDIRRMGDLTFCLTTVVTILGGYFNRDDMLEDYLSQYNDDFPHEERVREEIRRVFQVISDCGFDSSERVWKKADLFTLIIELHNAIFQKTIQIVPEVIAPRLKQFYQKVNAIQAGEPGVEEKDALAYHNAALQASNDKGNRIRRAEAIQKVLVEASATDLFETD